MKAFILLSVLAVAFAARECGENQHYDSCGTACPLTCENYNDPPLACIRLCIPGCHCDEGFVETKDGRCVRPEQCSAQSVCGENKRYNQCGTACPLTCENYQNPPRFCTLQCKIGCECEEGFVKASDGRCVRPEECPSQAPIQKSCLGEPETGLCEAYIPSWHYDIQTEKCYKFIYGGCGGNGNRYRTEEECLEHCGDVRLKQSSEDICDLPAEPGLCLGYFPRFHFNKKTGQCEEFIYGGCRGNENNFKTIEECQSTCGAVLTGAKVKSEVCSFPPETGMCRGYFPRYHYDESSGSCKKFIYGGCGGNENNFKTLEECHNTCA